MKRSTTPPQWILAICLLIVVPATTFAQAWDGLGDGTDGQVQALAFDGINVFLAGDFDNVDGATPASNIALWNPVSQLWAPLGLGITGVVNALAIHPSDGDLYVGGSFTMAGGAPARNVAIWTGLAWETLGTAPDDGIFGTVNALAFDSQNNLYAGGTLGATNTPAIADVNDIAKWDGAAWSVLGTAPEHGTGNSVNALAVASGTDDLYVGGTFVDVANGTVQACRVALWNGSAWSALGAGVDGVVHALALDSGNGLYAGGDFTEAADILNGGDCSLGGGITANRIASWDGANWSELIHVLFDNGLDNSVRALLADPLDNIVAAGSFQDAGGCPVLCDDSDRVAVWQPLVSTWLPLDKGFGNNRVNALTLAPSITLPKRAVDVSLLFAGGSFTLDGNSTTMNRVARFDVTLPVELTAFDAVVRDGGVILSWATASETSNAGFDVQHAREREGTTEWRSVGFVDGAGTTEKPQSYSFSIADLEAGTHRFRLKQIDFDGSFEFSPVLEVAMEVPGTHVLSAAYPNPFNPATTVTLAVARDQRVVVDLFDVTGRLVRQVFDGEVSANVVRSFTIAGFSLPSGIYQYRVAGEVFLENRTVVLVK